MRQQHFVELSLWLNLIFPSEQIPSGPVGISSQFTSPSIRPAHLGHLFELVAELDSSPILWKENKKAIVRNPDTGMAESFFHWITFQSNAASFNFIFILLTCYCNSLCTSSGGCCCWSHCCGCCGSPESRRKQKLQNRINSSNLVQKHSKTQKYDKKLHFSQSLNSKRF